jgi:NADH:ubiquinone oxidoreductase subunit D/NADH:ubiquinone oxidoreductase subunit C
LLCDKEKIEMAEETTTPAAASDAAPAAAPAAKPAPVAKPAAGAARPAAGHAAAKPPALAQLTPEMTAVQQKFGESSIQPAPYVGILVNDASKVREVAMFLRDELKYAMLANETAVDYIKDGYIELVYNAQRVGGGDTLTFKVRVPRPSGNDLTQPVPSLVPVYPGVEFQEREIYDMYGVMFSGHPDLRRILLWEGFNGWPLRKDWHEAYFEGDTKPFESRWPGGNHELAEERVPWDDNVNYPPGFDPLNYKADPDAGLYDSMLANVPGVPGATMTNGGNGPVNDSVELTSEQPTGIGAAVPVLDRNYNNLADEDELKTDQIIINMGPQHPSTHGVLRMVAKLDGEVVTDVKLVLGYLHRNHEKIGERNTWLHNIPYTDRLDYICGIANELGYVLAVEKMMGTKPTERAEYLRVIMTELTRIESHFWSIGFLLNDLGAFYTPALYFITERDLIIDLFEAVTGSRLMCNYMRFGGVSQDLTEAQIARARELAFERIPRKIDELETLLTDNEIIKARSIGVGYLSAERSIAYSLTGPCIRAAGVPYDIRRVDPYSIYDRFDWEVPVFYGADVYDRYRVRVAEMRQSVRIVQQALNQLDQTKPGDIQAGKKAYNHRVPAGQTYTRVETPKGELGFYLVSEGVQNAYRYHVRSSSFINLNSLKEMTLGQKVADAVVILGSLDIVLGEVDR